MQCLQCGYDTLAVTSTVKRSEHGDVRVVKCKVCHAEYSTLTVITDAIVYDEKRMKAKYIPISEYPKYLETQSEIYEKFKALRLSLFDEQGGTYGTK